MISSCPSEKPCISQELGALESLLRSVFGWDGLEGSKGAFSVNPADSTATALGVTIPAVRDLGGAFSGLPHPTPCATWLFCGCHEPLFLRGNFEEGDQWNQLQLPLPSAALDLRDITGTHPIPLPPSILNYPHPQLLHWQVLMSHRMV